MIVILREHPCFRILVVEIFNPVPVAARQVSESQFPSALRRLWLINIAPPNALLDANATVLQIDVFDLQAGDSRDTGPGIQAGFVDEQMGVFKASQHAGRLFFVEDSLFAHFPFLGKLHALDRIGERIEQDLPFLRLREYAARMITHTVATSRVFPLIAARTQCRLTTINGGNSEYCEDSEKQVGPKRVRSRGPLRAVLDLKWTSRRAYRESNLPVSV